MNKYNLQLFADAVSGKKIVYLFRALSKASENAGAILAFTTENSRTKSKDADATVTKDGTIRTPSASEVEISATCYVSTGDGLVDELESAMDSDAIIEIWEANLSSPLADDTTGTKFNGKYYQGYLTEIELSSDAEDFAEYSLTFGVNGAGVSSGDTGITVTKDQQAKAEASYKFVDSIKGATSA